MATRTVVTNNLVGLQSLSFIRPQSISFSLSDTKPNTRMYAFFDGRLVDAFLNTPIITDSEGKASGTFNLPAMTFNTGEREFKIQDSPTYISSGIPGSTVGSATAKFSASGVKQTWQQTVTNINQIQRFVFEPSPIPQRRDPLAQSFFTYNVKDGCFITSIELYFHAKDSSLPVTVELRELSNGYPTDRLISAYSSVTKSPSEINVSNNASIATKFSFERPIYLPENGEYCFVILTNSNNYLVWTSKMGEKSIETGKTIFEQPFIGSMFKSENNSTWSAEQSEDIKFTINRANFSTGSASASYKTNSTSRRISGKHLSVTSGSNVVTVKLPFQHGLKSGASNKVFFGDLGGLTYRGIPTAEITAVGGVSVATVPDQYTFTFTTTTNATSTGTLEYCNGITGIAITNPGAGYTDGTRTLSFTDGGGSGANISAVISGGQVVKINITSPGSGYTSAPTAVTMSGTGGTTTAAFSANIESYFSIVINREYQNVTLFANVQNPNNTSIVGSVKTTDTSYTIDPVSKQIPINTITDIGKAAILVSPGIETSAFSGQATTSATLTLSTNNSNVSPLIDLVNAPRLITRNYIVDNTDEGTSANGLAKSRYVSKKFTLALPAKGVRVLVNAASTSQTGFDVYIRTSLNSSNTVHSSLSWTKLTQRSTLSSTTLDDFVDYEFGVDGLTPFDVYDIKIVLRTTVRYLYPKIANYRAILLS